MSLAPDNQNMNGASVLPYRTDALALAEWLTARARGRSAEQLRTAVDSPKAVEGTAAAAVALGFIDAASGALTALGEHFALAEPEERRRLLLERVLAYPPYRETLRALAERGDPAETEVRWIEAFWSTRGHGGSESNRREGAAAFGRLADFAGLGEYIPGRRGRPTRIRWEPGALSRPGGGASKGPPPEKAISSEAEPDLFTAAPAPTPARRTPPAPRSRPQAPPASQADSPRALTRDPQEVNRITIPLSGEATARVEVPLRLPATEKRRLLDLLELLISEE